MVEKKEQKEFRDIFIEVWYILRVCYIQTIPNLEHNADGGKSYFVMRKFRKHPMNTIHPKSPKVLQPDVQSQLKPYGIKQLSSE